MTKKNNWSWEWLSLLLVSLLVALAIGNLIFFGYGAYIVPGINLDLMTFVYLLGYGSAIMLVALIIKKRR